MLSYQRFTLTVDTDSPITKFFKDRWVLILVLTVFTIAKLPALHFPFYWDESWSYAPGVKLMYLHGPSLMPNAIDLFYSRGHPLLFYASAAAWMKLFGDSHFAQHSFCLFLSLGLLAAIYEICLRLFSKRMAVISLLLVSSQIIIFVQSTMLLPEIMVSLLSLLALYCYATGKHLFTFFSLSALMLTKESGMVMGLVLGAHAVWTLFVKSESSTRKAWNILSVSGAWCVIVCFFLLQKKLNGWFFYPEHIGLMNFSWEMFKGKLRFCLEIMLYHQNRAHLYLLLILVSPLVALKTRDWRFILPLILGTLLFILAGEYFGYLTRRLLYPLLFILFIYSFFQLDKLYNPQNRQRSKFVFLLILFISGYLSFTCLNFFSNRYVMVSIIAFLLLASFCFDLFLRQVKEFFFYVLIMAVAGIAFFAFKNNSGIGDVDLGSSSAMQVQQETINYCEQHNMYDQVISAHSPLQRAHLTIPYTGFLSSDRKFSRVKVNVEPDTHYIIIDNIDNDSVFSRSQYPDFHPVFRTDIGGAWAEIYQRQ